MGFIRPEVRANLWRWREVAFMVIIVLACVRLIGRGWDMSSPVYMTLGGIGTVIATGLLYVAIQRARFVQPDLAPGVVEITERRVSYMGPVEGYSLSLDALTRVEIRQSQYHGPMWELYHTEGPHVTIPTAAKGADALFDTLAALKGADTERMIQATSHPTQDRYVIWEA